MCRIQTNRGSTQVFVYTTLFQTNPGSTRVEPTSGGGLDLNRVEPGLAVFTRQKLTRISFNPFVPCKQGFSLFLHKSSN